MVLRCGLWMGIIVLLGALLPKAPVASAKDTFVKELLLSLARPVEAQDEVIRWGEEIDRLISDRSWGSRQEGSFDSAPRIPFRGDYFELSQNGRAADFPARECFFPGNESLERLRRSFARVAALDDGHSVIDATHYLSPVGSTVGDASKVFSTLEILVDKASYTVRVFGITRKGQDKLLYSCKAGLGSPEYPTPRGSFFIERIFDENPLWIPPDRPWAWGEAPSRSVYGGHMMPLYIKKPLPASNGEEPVTNLDCIEGKMEMVDSGGYRVHGTNSPWSVGSGQSHGCVRLLNSSVKRIADLLKIYVGVSARDRSENGSFVRLVKPVRVILH
jgi:hypothetical protein